MKKLLLEELTLESGSHSTPEDGLCVMEAVAYIAGEPHSDRPQCACPILTSYMISLNDSMTKDERVLLKPYIERLINTRDDNSQKRMDILAKAALTKFAPYTLELTGDKILKEHAAKLRVLDCKDMKIARAAARAAAVRKPVWNMALAALEEALNVGKE